MTATTYDQQARAAAQRYEVVGRITFDYDDFERGDNAAPERRGGAPGHQLFSGFLRMY